MKPLRNALWQLLGAALPALALFVCIPLVVQRLGAEAWGVLALVGAIVGSFGAVELNAGAAALKLVAEHEARGERGRSEQVVACGLLIHGALGAAVACVIVVAAGPLAALFAITPAWRDEAVAALRLAGLAFAAAQVQGFLQSVLQGLQRYELSGRVEALFGSLAPLASIAVVLAGGGLAAIVAARLVAVVLQAAVLAVALQRLLPLTGLRRPDRVTWRAVAHFSGWAWLQRLAAVAQAQADRLLLGAQQSLFALAAYAVPATLAGRLFGLLFRLTQPLLPRASALHAEGRHDELRRLALDTLRYAGWLNAGAALLFALFARELLGLWLGPGLGDEAPRVLALLAVSLALDALTQVPSQVADGLGRPRLTGSAALLRALLGVAAALLALRIGGVVALAAAQGLVSALMAAGFVWAAHRRALPWPLADTLRDGMAPALLLLAAGTPLVIWRSNQPPLSPPALAAALAFTLAALALLGWHAVLRPAHRERMAAAVLRGPLPT